MNQKKKQILKQRTNKEPRSSMSVRMDWHRPLRQRKRENTSQYLLTETTGENSTPI